MTGHGSSWLACPGHAWGARGTVAMAGAVVLLREGDLDAGQLGTRGMGHGL